MNPAQLETLRTVITGLLAVMIVVGAFVHLTVLAGSFDSPLVAWGGLVLGYWFGARAGAGSVPGGMGVL